MYSSIYVFDGFWAKGHTRGTAQVFLRYARRGVAFASHQAAQPPPNLSGAAKTLGDEDGGRVAATTAQDEGQLDCSGPF